MDQLDVRPTLAQLHQVDPLHPPSNPRNSSCDGPRWTVQVGGPRFRICCRGIPYSKEIAKRIIGVCRGDHSTLGRFVVVHSKTNSMVTSLSIHGDRTDIRGRRLSKTVREELWESNPLEDIIIIALKIFLICDSRIVMASCLDIWEKEGESIANF